MSFMIILVSLVVLGAVLGMWFASGYNGLVRLRAMLDEAWSGIDVQLKRRYDLIPNIVESVKGYASHEKGVFEQVTKMRSAAVGATTVEAKSQAEQGLNAALKTLFAVAENYPELKANQNFIHLQQELSKIETEIQLSRRYYNGTARNYNIVVQSFPSRFIASLTGFAKAAYFELDGEVERKAPRVSFE